MTDTSFRLCLVANELRRIDRNVQSKTTQQQPFDRFSLFHIEAYIIPAGRTT